MIGIVGALTSALGFGTANVVIKRSLSNLSIPQTLMMSTLSGAFFMSIFILLNGASERVTTNLLLLSFVFAVAEVILYLVLYKTFSVSNVTVATAVSGTYPIIATLFTVIVLSETIDISSFSFILLIVLGAILTSIRWEDVFKKGFNQGDLVQGFPWIIATTLIHSLYFPLLGNFTERGSWEIKLLLIKLFSALILFSVFFLIRKQTILPPKQKVPFTSLLGLLEVIGWAGYTWATSSTEGRTGVIIATLNSAALVTAVWAYFVLEEKLSKLQYTGILIIVTSVTALSL